MATTHALVADTRMEDLPGLASGDTIALGGHVLTCESNLSAITGLYATGTGTIRLLDGANCDFSGSNPLPATVTIEGGTEDNPLPAHGDYGYIANAAAVLNLKGGTIFYGFISSHCIGNAARIQAAICVASSSSMITLDRDVDWSVGDVVGEVFVSQSGNGSKPMISIASMEGRTIFHTSGQTVGIGSIVILLTTGFVVGASSGTIRLGGYVFGDEVGVNISNGAVDGICFGRIDLHRLTIVHNASAPYVSYAPALGATRGKIGVLCNMGGAIGANAYENAFFPINYGPVNIGAAFVRGVGSIYSHVLHSIGSNIRINGGMIAESVGLGGHNEFLDVNLPTTLYTGLYETSELVIRTIGAHPTAGVHRSGGIATRVEREDIEVPTSLPDAWRLDPIEDGTAWHDVPMTVLPGKTLSCIWYWMLGEEGATAGCQILDGECPGWGLIAMNPGLADVLAETAAPAGASPLRPFVAVPISWRNPGREIRKVVLRGWARGGTAYSRIDPAAGGLA